MADDKKTNGGKPATEAGTNAVAGGTATADGTTDATGPIRRALAQTLGRMIMIPQLRKEHKLSRRNAVKLLDELERQRPTIWEEACNAAGIEIGVGSPDGRTGAIFDGHILNWLMDPANQQKIMDFGKFLATFIQFLLPLFGA